MRSTNSESPLSKTKQNKKKALTWLQTKLLCHDPHLNWHCVWAASNSVVSVKRLWGHVKSLAMARIAVMDLDALFRI